MTNVAVGDDILLELDEATRLLIRLAAALAAGAESDVRASISSAQGRVPDIWAEELILQTYLFAGFPRALNGMRHWRRERPAVAGGPAVTGDVRSAGERTCAQVYGPMYEKLRTNIRELHPLLDDWMIAEGYGKVLSRPGLDLPRRELCIVAACAASGQDRQLQSHLHGARNAGVSARALQDAIASLKDVIPHALHERATHLWNKVRTA